MTNLVQALRILCSSTVPGNRELGIYTASGRTEIRLSEDAGFQATLPYTAGFIVDNGIGAIEESADLRRGGDMASLSGVTVTLRNAERLFLTLKSGGVYLQGCPAELHEFEWDATAHPEPSESTGTLVNTTIFTGIVDDVQWDALGLVLKLKNSRYRRNAMIASIIDNGNYTDVDQVIADLQAGNARGNYPFADSQENGRIVPVTFGRFDFDGTTGIPAKMLRTANAEADLAINGTTSHNGSATTPDYCATDFGNPGDTDRYELRISPPRSYCDPITFPVVLSDAGATPAQANPARYGIRLARSGSGDTIRWYKNGTDQTPGSGCTILAIAGTKNGTTVTTDGSDPEGVPFGTLYGRYLKVVDGTGSSGLRMIVGAQVAVGSGSATLTQGSPLYTQDTALTLAADPTVVVLTLAAIFDTALAGNATADATGQSWCAVKKVWREYKADEW